MHFITAGDLWVCVCACVTFVTTPATTTGTFGGLKERGKKERGLSQHEASVAASAYHSTDETRAHLKREPNADIITGVEG